MTPMQIYQALGINPSPATFDEYLAGWETVAKAAKALSALEMTMRKGLFATCFPHPKEGTNNYKLPDGRTLAGNYKITRNIDETQVQLARSEYDLVNDRPVLFDELIKTKVELVTASFRKLEANREGEAYKAASRMIVAKPGAPSLEVK